MFKLCTETMKCLRNSVIAFCIFQLCFSKLISALSYHAEFNLTTKVLEDYHKNIRPVQDQTKSVGVTLKWYPNFIIEFNDVTGILTIMSAVHLRWYDELIHWNKSDINKRYLRINAEQVWFPYLGVINGVESTSFHEKDLKTGQVIFKYTGDALFPSVAVTKTYCQPNMFYFPFDEHNCSVHFYPLDYLRSEVYFTNKSKSSFVHLDGNKQFNIKSHYTKVHVDAKSDISFVTFTLLLKRRSFFILLNYCSPILTLSFLGLFVFVLPLESGERISYSVTMFLSLAVFLTMIADKLPDNDPIPIFTYFLIGKILFSSLILLCTIISVRCHNDDKSSGFWKTIQGFFLWFSNKGPRDRKNHRKRESYKDTFDRSPVETSDECFVEDSFIGRNVVNTSEKHENERKTSDVETHDVWSRRWERNAKIFDRICFFAFLTIIICEFIFLVAMG